MRALLIVCLLSTAARADVWIGGSVGAGVEAQSRHEAGPTPLGRWAISMAWIPSRGNVGVGLSTGVIARSSELFETHLEVHSDLMVRFASDDRRLHGGLGLGIRTLTLKPAETPGAVLLGMDLVHGELSTRLARWGEKGVWLGLDGFGSLTVGCYRGRLEEVDLVESPAMTVGCADTLATTVVVGLSIALESSKR